MPVDNLELVLPFVPDEDDGEHFIYTEMIDRSKKRNPNVILKTFYHRSKRELVEQMPSIRRLCEIGNVRAGTRLGLRSWKRVGQNFARLVVDTALEGNYTKMKSLYNKVLGNTSPVRKVWIWDIDTISTKTDMFVDFLRGLRGNSGDPVYLGRVPSKTGYHILSHPFDTRIAAEYIRVELGLDGGLSCNGDTISLHKDNPTNLYIPDGAD